MQHLLAMRQMTQTTNNDVIARLQEKQRKRLSASASNLLNKAAGRLRSLSPPEQAQSLQSLVKVHEAMGELVPLVMRQRALALLALQ